MKDIIGECLPNDLTRGHCYTDPSEADKHYWYMGRSIHFGGLPMFECFEYLSEEDDLGDGNTGHLVYRTKMIDNLERCSKHDIKDPWVLKEEK
ncbi:MAG: hypothetical protein QQN63_12475 [Nitrosopumilus sp.]